MTDHDAREAERRYLRDPTDTSLWCPHFGEVLKDIDIMTVRVPGDLWPRGAAWMRADDNHAPLHQGVAADMLRGLSQAETEEQRGALWLVARGIDLGGNALTWMSVDRLRREALKVLPNWPWRPQAKHLYPPEVLRVWEKEQTVAEFVQDAREEAERFFGEHVVILPRTP